MGALKIETVPLRREIVLVAVLFLVGLASGLYFGRALGGEPHSAPTDYAILVARLYENDQSKTQAIARLQAGGVDSPAQAVATIAAGYPTDTPAQARDADSLLKLARALGAPADSSSGTSGIPTSYILAALVGVCALGLVALLAVRVLGLQLPSLPKAPSLGRGGLPTARSRVFQPANRAMPATSPSPDPTPRAALPRTPEPVADPPAGEAKNGSAPGKTVPPPTKWTGPQMRTRPMEANEAASVNGNGRAASANGNTPKTNVNGNAPAARRDVVPPPIKPVPLRSEPNPKGFSFRSSYRLGDEPYDEIHPISDDTGRSLVGACGVRGARFLNEHGQKRYWGFTAWLQDYAGEGQFRAVGLVSRWASDHLADQIDDWRDEGEIDEVRLVDFDARLAIETSLLAASMSIDDVDYVPGVPPEAIFNRLAAQFDVRVSRASETGRPSEPAG